MGLCTPLPGLCDASLANRQPDKDRERRGGWNIAEWKGVSEGLRQRGCQRQHPRPHFIVTAAGKGHLDPPPVPALAVAPGANRVAENCTSWACDGKAGVRGHLRRCAPLLGQQRGETRVSTGLYEKCVRPPLACMGSV